MKKALSPATGSGGSGSKMHNTMVYLRQHWQLYVPASRSPSRSTTPSAAFSEVSGSASSISSASCPRLTSCGI